MSEVQTEEKKENKKEAGETKLTAELKTVAGANTSANILPKGEIKQPEQTAQPEKKDGRGRPPKDESKEGQIKSLEEKLKKLKSEEKTKGEKIFLTPMVNSTLIPLAAKKYKKKPEDLQYNDAEIALLNGLQPPIYTETASWPAYAITAISLLVVHFYTAETLRIDKEIEDLKSKVEKFANDGNNQQTFKGRQNTDVSGSQGFGENTDNKKARKK